MVRQFDSGDPPPVLVFTELVDCPACATTSEGVFADGSLSVEDITDPPVGQHTCPACGHTWASELTGWIMFGEAG